MTKEEYNDLTKGDLVHYKDDNPTTHPKYYDWEIMHINKDGMMIENDYSNPQYLDFNEVLDKLDISKKTEKIESWRLNLKSDDSEAWDGEITITLNTHDLSIIVQALRTGEYEGTISKEDQKYILDKLNIDDGL